MNKASARAGKARWVIAALALILFLALLVFQIVGLIEVLRLGRLPSVGEMMVVSLLAGIQVFSIIIAWGFVFRKEQGERRWPRYAAWLGALLVALPGLIILGKNISRLFR